MMGRRFYLQRPDCSFVLWIEAFLGPQYPFPGNSTFATELAPYIALISFLLIIVMSHGILGRAAFRRKRLTAAEVMGGATSTAFPIETTDNKWRQALTAVLNFL
jgi:hypothetical protein